MATENFKKAGEIFQNAIEIEDLAKRMHYLEDACEGDEKLRAEVEALLDAHEKAGGFLKARDIDPNATLDDPPTIDGPGTKIGRYELLEQIGEGGMGLVYIAQQKKPVKRNVALKIIKPGMDSKQVIARFEAERQALAVLDHPNIARVLDAGTTREGRPYFIMEYVKGVSITRYCDEKKFSIEKRLRLFEEVCEGIHHAHQKGIIHRDLKPSNILVSVHGDRAVTKIIDFGIAKAITQPLTEKTFVTFQGQLLGTPEYMSPEQVDMATHDIDTRSDIYSLGVVLYELLAGVLPFEREVFANLGFAEVQRTIREQEPVSPSTRLTSLGEEAKTIAASRNMQVVALARRLHRELEWIPLKAMRKDRCRRYRSASEMADDVRNYLSGLPLIAGPETTIYRIQKFVHKHAGSVATVALLAIVIVLGLIFSTTNYIKAKEALGKEEQAKIKAQKATEQAEEAAEEARQAAEQEATARAEAEQARSDAQKISNFLTKVVLGSAPKSVKGRDATVLEIFDVALKQIDAYFESEPNIEASIRNTMGWTYRDLGDFKASVLHLERVYQISGSIRGHRNWLGISQRLAGDYEAAERSFEAVRQSYIQDRRDVPRFATCNLATVYAKQGRYQEAEELFLKWFGKPAEGEPNRPGLNYEYRLATVEREQGRYEEAEKRFVSVLNAQRAIFGTKGDDLGWMIHCMNELARLYVIQNRYEEAEALYEEGIALGDNHWPGKDHPYTMRHVNGLGVVRTKQGRFVEAEALFNRALEGRKRKLGEDHPYTLETINDLGLLRRAQQRHKEAEDLLTEALERRQTKLGRDHPRTLESMHELGVLYLAQSRYQAAERLLLDALHGRETRLGSEHPQTVNSLRELAHLYESWNKPNKAGEYRTQLSQVKPREDYDHPALIGYDTFASLGKITYDDTNDTYTMLGSGRDIWLGADQFHYAHKRLNGDGSITARIESIEHLHNWTKAGVMIRESTAANSAYAFVHITPQNRVLFKHRSATGKRAIAIDSKPNTITLPCWIKLMRKGNKFTGECSEDDINWKKVEGGSKVPVWHTESAVANIDMNDPVLIGLAVCSRVGPGNPAEAKMSAVTLIGDVDPPGSSFRLEAIGFRSRALPDQ